MIDAACWIRARITRVSGRFAVPPRRSEVASRLLLVGCAGTTGGRGKKCALARRRPDLDAEKLAPGAKPDRGAASRIPLLGKTLSLWEIVFPGILQRIASCTTLRRISRITRSSVYGARCCGKLLGSTLRFLRFFSLFSPRSFVRGDKILL